MSKMYNRTLHFVQGLFLKYYTDSFQPLRLPKMVEKREFGFMLFEGWMLRHKGFKNESSIKEFLQSSVPSDAYSSCAYYENPEAEMDKKGWLGADLVFDIDADHIPTSCNKIHDEWTCGNCNFVGKGLVPETCPACGSKKLDVKTWPCEACLNSAKTETVKLLAMLTDEFGFSENEIRVFFSGHRGYHVHVENEAVKSLDSIMRKEIVDYISGVGFDLVLHGLDEKSLESINTSRNPSVDFSGWNKRITNQVYHLIENARKEDLVQAGLTKNVADAMLKNKDTILKRWKTARALSSVKGATYGSIAKLMEFCAREQSAKIDTVVTTDIHRLIRLPNTLHGKTGLKKDEFPASAINDYDPFKHAIAFKKGAVTVFASDVPEFKLGDQTFGPYKMKKVELPTAAALLLVCKGRAEVPE